MKINLESYIKEIKISPSCNFIFAGTEDGDIFTIDPKREFIVKKIASFNRNIREIIISPN